LSVILEKKRLKKGFAAKVYEEETVLMHYFSYKAFLTFFLLVCTMKCKKQIYQHLMFLQNIV